MRALPNLLPVGAATLWFHFRRGAELTAVGRPNKSKDLLEDNELREAHAASGGWQVVVDETVNLPDKRPISEFVAVKYPI